MTRQLAIYFAFWAGAAAGSLTTLSGIIADIIGFDFPFALIFPAAAFIVFGRPLWKLRRAMDMPRPPEKRRWGRG